MIHSPHSLPLRNIPRRGTILILIAGISALLVSLSLVFLTRMRTDVEESQLVLQQAQAKIMLAAACNYVQETSRLGWDSYFVLGTSKPAGDTPTVPNGTGVLQAPSYGNGTGIGTGTPSIPTLNIHEETYGWVDSRDGSVGPKTRGGGTGNAPPRVVWNVSATEPGGMPMWPAVGSVARCPMYVMNRPPYATQLTVAYNPINTTTSSPVFGLPLLAYPDPMPVVANGWPQASASGSVSTTLYDDGQNGATGTDFIHGDPTAREWTTGKSWFRVYRDGPATFVVTCGSGGSQAWKSWQECQTVGGSAATAQFNNDQTFFDALINNEFRIWYRIEWSAATMEQSYQTLQHSTAGQVEHFLTWPANMSNSWNEGPRTSCWSKNPGGTIRWIQRLSNAPTNY